MQTIFALSIGGLHNVYYEGFPSLTMTITVLRNESDAMVVNFAASVSVRYKEINHTFL